MKVHMKGQTKYGFNEYTQKQTVSKRTYCGFFITEKYNYKTSNNWDKITCLNCQNKYLDRTIKQYKQEQ